MVLARAIFEPVYMHLFRAVPFGGCLRETFWYEVRDLDVQCLLFDALM